MSQINRFWREEEGQALTEYGLLIGLIAVGSIVALTALGPKIAALFTHVKDSLPTIGS